MIVHSRNSTPDCSPTTAPTAGAQLAVVTGSSIVKPLAGAGEDRHPALVDLAEQADNVLALFPGEADKFAGAAVGIEPVDTGADEPVDVALHLLVVDFAAAVEDDEKELIQTIREQDKETYLLIQPGPFALPKGYRDFEPVDDDRAVYSFHFYAPKQYTHQGVRAERHHTKGQVRYPGYVKTMGGLMRQYWDRDRMEEFVQPILNFQEEHQVKFIVTGFSTIRWAPDQEAWMTDVIDLFEQYEWDWCYHNFMGWNGWNPTFDADDEGKRVV